MLPRHSWTGEPRSLYTGTHASWAWPFPKPKAGRQVQSLDTRGTCKVWQEEGGEVTKQGFITVLSHRTQTSVAREHGQRSLGCGWVMLFLLAPTGLADTTDYTWGSQEEQG